ncbi:PilW family protein [Kinneretia aquatilis]|uniref:PilW family protein n=1 Tax=Kinneretia aquatilis TaxID=2070761 RepID=UPI0014952DA7|nr:PilW family protein [Paucibacter aquatile]WIV98877.1 PilW family protein [Paucibacter aquatile]
MKSTNLQRPEGHPQNGFSLIELLVGVVLGMIAVIVVMQVFSLSERGQRSATSGDEAQTNGAIAATELQRNIRQSGHGAANLLLAGCSLTLPGGRVLSGLGPVTINHASIPAGDSGSDTLLVVFSNGNGAPEGDRIIAEPSAVTYTLTTATAFNTNDYVIAANQVRPAPCNLLLDRVNAAPVGANVSVAAGAVGLQDTLFNWGLAPKVLAYAVRNGRLTQCDYMVNDCSSEAAQAWVEIIDNVVNLRAQYGRDTSAAPMDGIVDLFDQTTPATACQWARMSAVRLAITTVSGQREKTIVTDSGNAPRWAGTEEAPIDLSAENLWQYYRYKVFEAIVPLRNLAWQGAVATC